jgi:uncharacterized membrane protein
MNTALIKKARRARISTLLLLGLLVLLLMLQTLLLPPAGMQLATIVFVMLLKPLPLLFFFWPIHRGQALSAAWLSFVLMLYFVLAVLGLYEPGLAGELAAVKAVLISACFTSAMLFTRWQRAILEQPAANATAAATDQ